MVLGSPRYDAIHLLDYLDLEYYSSTWYYKNTSFIIWNAAATVLVKVFKYHKFIFSGVPLVFPLIGVFVFTKTKSIGSFSAVEHNYISDRRYKSFDPLCPPPSAALITTYSFRCFLKPESLAFYTLFLAPQIVCLITNLVFFVFILRVVSRSSQNSTAGRKEVLKVGLFAKLITYEAKYSALRNVRPL